ncbi:N,N-dimethylformamidase beta subunit family domain-containing protein [Actinosynnema sp. NPDC051121]
MSVDPFQNQLRMVPAGEGAFYSVRADGELLFYRHLGWQTGAVDWANGGAGVRINAGWHEFTTVLAAADGQLFGFSADGTVRWYRYLAASGTWAAGGGTVIGTGFQAYGRLFGGWDGIVYGVTPTGALHWFRYLAGNGTTGSAAWANGARPVQIKSDVRLYKVLVADQGGVIYGARWDERLDWFRHDGGGTWANGGEPVPIGTGWTAEYQREFTAQGGSLYSVFIDRASPPGPDHELNWFRLANWQGLPLGGTPQWANGGVGKPVGTGWTTSRTANLQGYPDRWSVPVGGSLGVKVSSTFPSFQVTVRRLRGPLPTGATTVWGPVTRSGRLQLLPAGYRRSGCGWADDVVVPIDPAWPSGLYTATLTGPRGMERQVPFVVKPVTPTKPLAVMLPTLTHNAYDTWAGHSQYTWDVVPTNRYITTRKPLDDPTLRPTGRLDARWYGDLLLLGWLNANGFDYDCYQDVDLHDSGDWLAGHRALLLGTHPEYWTLTMRNRLVEFIDGGGRVVSPGGNAIYEPVDVVDGGATAVHRDPSGQRVPYSAHGLPPHDVLGVSYEPDTFLTFEPYRVVADHPFLSGTGLAVGSTFGHTGSNGSASGWETDAAPAGLPGVRVIAQGLQPDGADLVFFERGAGWAFAAGSLTFPGVLAGDAAASALLRNAVTAAVA